MKAAIMILAIVLGIMFEQFWPSSVFIGFARPPILAGIVAYYALSHSALAMLFTAALGGIVSDGIGSLPPGVTSLALAAIGAALHYYRNVVFSGKLVTHIVFGALIGMSAPLIIGMLLLFLGQTPFCPQFRVLFLKIIGTMVYGAFLFPVTNALLERLEFLTGAARRLDRFPDDAHSDN